MQAGGTRTPVPGHGKPRPPRNTIVLEMFPYPSGHPHGPCAHYTIGDVVARYKRMRGFNVLHPHGLGRLRHAGRERRHRNNTPPARWTYANIDNMRAQLKRLGFSYDWKREVATCPTGILPLGAVAFSAHVRKGACRPRNPMSTGSDP